jgi:hypothetical protein
MTQPLPFKRPARRRGPERPRYSEAEFAATLAEWEILHDIAAELPHWQPGDTGRPPLFPPAVILLFSVMRWGWGSDRSVERQLTHQPTWEPIRQSMARRYPDYLGLRPGAKPITRHQLRHFRDGLDDDTFERLLTAFRQQAADLSLAMGMFDPARISLTHPDPTTMLAGDATVIRSRFDAAPGTRYMDSETGEILEKLSDPDALWYPTFDEFGNKKRDTVYGTKFGILQARLPGHEHERVVIDLFHITSGDDGEPLSVERAVERFQRLAPALTGIVYDMALHGVHREHLYDLGLHTITKCSQVQRGKLREFHVGTLEARKDGVVVDKIEVRSIGGCPHTPAITSGKKEYIPLERVRTLRRKNKQKRKGARRHRWYNEMRVPADPRIPSRLHGARVMIRLDDENYETAKVSRAHNIHSIAPGEDEWETLFDLRNPTESINNWIKERLQGKSSRAPAVGARRQHLALLGAALYNNLAASLAQAERLKRIAA